MSILFFVISCLLFAMGLTGFTSFYSVVKENKDEDIEFAIISAGWLHAACFIFVASGVFAIAGALS